MKNYTLRSRIMLNERGSLIEMSRMLAISTRRCVRIHAHRVLQIHKGGRRECETRRWNTPQGKSFVAGSRYLNNFWKRSRKCFRSSLTRTISGESELLPCWFRLIKVKNYEVTKFITLCAVELWEIHKHKQTRKTSWRWKKIVEKSDSAKLADTPVNPRMTARNRTGAVGFPKQKELGLIIAE